SASASRRLKAASNSSSDIGRSAISSISLSDLPFPTRSRRDTNVRRSLLSSSSSVLTRSLKQCSFPLFFSRLSGALAKAGRGGPSESLGAVSDRLRREFSEVRLDRVSDDGTIGVRAVLKPQRSSLAKNQTFFFSFTFTD